MAVSVHELLPPICVDLDCTLIRSDSLFEALIALLKKDPLSLLALPRWLAQGRAGLHREITRRAAVDPTALPYDGEVLAWLKSERQSGRSIWLSTPADPRFAQAVAEHLGMFDGVLASDGSRPGVACETGKDGRVVKSFARDSRLATAILRLLRPHQWAKNVLIFVPLLAAHGEGGAHALLNAVLAFISFCLCASAVYVLNDLLDVEADRAHPRKCRRPLAAGQVPLGMALALSPVLLVCAGLIAVFLPPRFGVIVGMYAALTTTYSFALKGLVLVDAICLAGLYTLRIIAGAAASQVPLSFWLLLFAVFLFLSLAFVKRYAELDGLRRQMRLKAVGRGYHVEDLPLLQSLGTAAGYLSVLVLALYINSPAIESLYRRPKYIWTLCVLMLYWISRVWMKAHRGTMHDDPVVFAFKDGFSIAIGILAAITVAAAI
jgi:4-hydroxybenzoate polyprenyltransferase